MINHLKVEKKREYLNSLNHFKIKKKKMKIDKIKLRGEILNLVAKNKQVIYGGQSLNHFLPAPLKVKTEDFDILTRKPKQSAEETAKILNKKFNSNRFQVKEAIHKGTFKVKDIQTGKTIADYTGTTKKPKSYNLFGVRFAKETYSENKIKKILKDPKAMHRWEKDKSILLKIKQAKRKL